MSTPVIKVDEATIERRKALGNFNENASQLPNWTREECNILRELYPDNTSEDITLFINRSVSAIRHKANRLGLTKSEAFLKSCDSGRFQPKPEKREPFLKRLLKLFGR